jgi:hypothetical protein
LRRDIGRRSLEREIGLAAKPAAVIAPAVERDDNGGLRHQIQATGPGGEVDSLLPFNIRRFADFSFLSNDLGESAFVDAADSRRLLAGEAPVDAAKVQEFAKRDSSPAA